jgi:transposase
MATAMLDARQQEGAYRRVELITGHRRRRQWTPEGKAWIVAESISEVARRHGVGRWMPIRYRRDA